VHTKSCRLQRRWFMIYDVNYPIYSERVISLRRLSNMYVQNLICQIIIDFVRSGGIFAAWKSRGRKSSRPTSICALALEYARRGDLRLCATKRVPKEQRIPLSVAREKFVEFRSRNVKSSEERYCRKNSRLDRPSGFSSSILLMQFDKSRGTYGTLDKSSKLRLYILRGI